MKITKRIKKILLILLDPENTFPWVSENFPWAMTQLQAAVERGGYPYWIIWSICESKKRLSHSEKISFSRTFRIMINRGLIEEHAGWSDYRLTEAGVQKAVQIRKEIRDFIKEFANLT